jgi:hypothetical protein
MAETPEPKANKCGNTVRLPIDQDEYQKIIDDPAAFRKWINSQFELHPELFPKNFANYFVFCGV